MIGPIDLILIGIVALVAWCVASEGAYGAAMLCLCVIFSGLIAMNYFELLANMLPATGWWRTGSDVLCLVGLFIGCVLALRYATEYLCPRFIQVQGTLYEVGRWSCSVLAGYVTMAFLLTALHTAPLPREFLGFKPERDNLLNLAAPDRQWLGFTHFVSEHVFRKGVDGKLFDGPRLALGDPHDPYPNKVWPSFPIRYATRRGSAPGAAAESATSGGGRQRLERPRTTGGAGGF
jgi:hypothetical protein